MRELILALKTSSLKLSFLEHYLASLANDIHVSAEPYLPVIRDYRNDRLGIIG